MQQFRIRTQKRTEFVDITSQVREAVRKANVDAGICVVYCPHTTGAITVNENADPDVARDMGMALGKLVPHEWGYKHGEGNSDSHIQTSLVGPSQTLIVNDGDVFLGRWQGVYFCEFDGPRERMFFVKTLSDSK